MLLPTAPSYDAWSHPTARVQNGPSLRCCATCDVIKPLKLDGCQKDNTVGFTDESNSLRRTPICTIRLRRVWRCL